MRVVLITDDHPPMVGGVSVFAGRVAEGLVRSGHEVRVIARGRPGIAAVPGTRLTTVRGPLRWARGAAWTALLRADRVLATTWPVATGLVALGVPFDVVAHGSDVTRGRSRAFDQVWGAAGRRFAMSRFLAGYVEGEVLPAPIPVASTPRERGAGWVLVARATPLKGGDRFVRWVAEAREDGVVVGDGPELGAWVRLAAELGARVRFVGQRTPAETLEIVRGSALAVLVPRADADGTGAEGFGFALVEAMGQGVPAVGCRTGGVPEAVGPGLLVDDPDDVAGSVAAVRAFLAGEPGRAGWEWVRANHGIERTVEKIEGRVDPSAGRSTDG